MTFPDGMCASGPALVGDDLIDDRVPEVIGLGGQHRQRCIGEHGVVAAALRDDQPVRAA
jgi:hypothetical protein